MTETLKTREPSKALKAGQSLKQMKVYRVQAHPGGRAGSQLPLGAVGAAADFKLVRINLPVGLHAWQRQRLPAHRSQRQRLLPAEKMPTYFRI